MSLPIDPRAALASLAALLVALAAAPLAEAWRTAQDGAGPAAPDAELLAVAEEIQGDVEALRGLEFERAVEFERIDADGIDAFLSHEIERQGGAERIAFSGAVLQMLGLLDADQDVETLLRQLLRDQIAGLYDPSTKRFFLASGLHPALVRTTLAHELVHALDDQHYDLGAALDARRGDADRQWAYQALAEGSATLVHSRWMEANIGSFAGDDLREVMKQASKGLDGVPEVLWKPLVGAYLSGTAFLVRSSDALTAQLKQPRPGDVDRAFAAPPESSEQVLHPEKYWDEAQHDAPTAVALEVGELPDGWRVAGEDTLGEIGVALATTQPAASAKFDPLALARLRHTNEAATGWDGDRHVLLERDGARVLVSEFVFDAQEDAAQFGAALAKLTTWRLERLAALSGAAGEPVGTEPAPHGEVIVPVSGQPRVRWMLYSGAPRDEAERLAALVRLR